MYKIAVIGGGDMLSVFGALGLDTFAAADSEDAKQIFRRLTSDKEAYAVIYIDEQFARTLDSDIAEFNGKAFPAVVILPSGDGYGESGLTALRETVKRATGADIL